MDAMYEVYLFFKILDILGPVNPCENLGALSLFPEKCSCTQIFAHNFWSFMNPRSLSMS